MIRALILSMALAAPGGIDQLGWMAGCWEGRLGAVTLQENWSRPAGGAMLGSSRNLRGGKTIFSEFMRITEENGKIVYMARIGTKADPTPFTMIRMSAEEIVFENPQHDFPQRILYRKSADSLFARIEGVEKGAPRGEDYPMRRAKCE